MNVFLFLLSHGCIQAFCSPSNTIEALKYQGRAKMPYESASDLREFMLYMLKEYAQETADQVCIVSCEQDAKSIALAAEAIAAEPNMPPFALYTLPYLLPSFCRKKEVPSDIDYHMSFDGNTWRIHGMRVMACAPVGRNAYYLEENDVARLFFAPDPISASEKGITQKQVERNTSSLGELAQYVASSAFKPERYR